MSTTVNATTNTSGAGSITSGTSLQFMYAKLQLTQSNQMKTQAEELMKQIEEKQQLQQQVANMISAARDAQSKAGDKDSTAMSDELKAFFTAHNLSYQETDGKCNKDQWEYNIKSLTNYQDTLGTDTQTKMVYLQDYISQYNSYLQGASQQISDSGTTMQTILRNS